MARYVLAIDQGTTGSTVVVFDESGRVRSRAYSEFSQHYPRPAWVEHDPEEIWRVTRGLLGKACRAAKIRPRDLAAIGITNQRETTVVWDRKSGKPVYNAIVWQDRRTADTCATLEAGGLLGEVRRNTGLVLDPYFSATKVSWILDHVRGARARAARGELAFGTIDSWLIWKLTAGKSHVDRLHQRVANAALQHPLARLGPTPLSRVQGAGRAAAAGGAVGRCRRRDGARDPRADVDPDRRHRR